MSLRKNFTFYKNGKTKQKPIHNLNFDKNCEFRMSVIFKKEPIFTKKLSLFTEYNTQNC